MFKSFSLCKLRRIYKSYPTKIYRYIRSITPDFPDEVNLQDIQRLQESTELEKENQSGEETKKQTHEQSEDPDHPTEGHLSSGPTQRSMKRQRSRYPLNMMQACVECYQNFFHMYSTTKVLQSEEIARQCMERLVCPQEGMRSEESDSVLDTASEYSFEDHVPSAIDQSNYQTLVPADRLSEDVIDLWAVVLDCAGPYSRV